MKKLIIAFAIILAASTGAFAQKPTIAAGGVLNIASNALTPLPNSSIAQGSMFVVYGSNLGPASVVLATSLPLAGANGLGGTSVKITQGSTSLDAFMIYSLSSQIAVVMPSNAPTGTVQLTVSYNGQTSDPVNVTVVRNSPGIFTRNQAGSGPAIIQNFNSQADQPLNAVTTVARPGQLVILWATGLGPVSGNEAAGAGLGTDLRGTFPIEVWVGTQKVADGDVLYAGRSGSVIGVDQIAFRVPATATGCYVNVFVKVGAIVSNFTTIAVAPEGQSTCSDGNGFAAADLQRVAAGQNLRVGIIDLASNNLTLSLLGQNFSIPSDTASALFASYTPAQVNNLRGVTQAPSVNTCSTSVFRGSDPTPVDPTALAITPLNAGTPLNLTGPAGAKTVPRITNGTYNAVVGGAGLDQILQLLQGNAPPSYYRPGSYTITNGSGATGDNAVGAISGATVNIPAAVAWSNRDQISTINRANPLTVNWTGGDPAGYVTITIIGSTGSGAELPSATTPGVAVLCVASAAAGTFTIPAEILSVLPPSVSAPGAIVPTKYMLVGISNAPVKFTAPGLDAGYLSYRFLSGKGVSIQ